MKTATLIVGEALSTVTPRDMYVLEIKYMHGDADVYTTEKYTFKPTQIELLQKTLVLIEEASTYDFEVTNGRKWLRNFLVERSGLSVEDVDVFFDNYVQGDATCDHEYVANFEEWLLTYYDHDGVGYDVDATIA